MAKFLDAIRKKLSFRRQVKYYDSFRPGNDSTKIDMLNKFAMVLDYSLLKNYKPGVGDGVEIRTGFLTSEGLLAWLAEVIEIVAAREYIEEGLVTVPLVDHRTMSLDDFLVNNEGGSVDPYSFAIRLRDKLEQLQVAIEYIEEERYKTMYERKLGEFFMDIFGVQQALLTASFNHE